LVIYYLVAAFKLWMLIDCARRRAETYWYFVIFVPLGAVAYFFLVKIHDYDLRWLQQAFRGRRGPTPQQLRYHARETPSAENRNRLAQALFDESQYQEARELFATVLKTYPADTLARYGLGRCQLELGDCSAAADTFARVVDDNPSFRDHGVWLDLAEACRRAGRDTDATRALQLLVRLSPTTAHQLALAEHLEEVGEVTRARQVIDKALEDFEHSPPYVKRRHRRAAQAATELRRRLAEER
jgi:hypothetical protein